jgi:hypothetical protein
VKPFAAIIPHRGDKSLIETCLQALNPWSEWIGLVHVVDDNQAGAGFTHACNQGLLRELCQPTSEHLLLVNNDCVPDTNPFAPLYDQLRAPRVGIASPMNVDYSDRDRIIWGGGLQVNPGVHKAGSIRLGQWRRASEEAWATFSVVAIKRAVIEQIGLLDHRFHNVCSDADLCFRARAAGWQVWYEPRSRWAHKLGHSQATDPAALRGKRYDTTKYQEMVAAQELYQWTGELPM